MFLGVHWGLTGVVVSCGVGLVASFALPWRGRHVLTPLAEKALQLDQDAGILRPPDQSLSLPLVAPGAHVPASSQPSSGSQGLGAVAALVLFIAVGAGLAAWDWHRATRPNLFVVHQSRTALAGGAAGLGLWAAIALVGSLTSYSRLTRNRKRGVRPFTLLIVISFVLSMGLWVWEHPRYGTDPQPVSTTKTFLLGCSAGLDLAIALVLPVWVLVHRWQTYAAIRNAYSHPPGHVCDKETEVWHVTDDRQPPSFTPYYIAHCDCLWVGTAFPATDPDSESNARAEAHAHSRHVVVDSLEMP
jgi:hypothetical protein